jgi:hypothetical protein
MMKATLTYRCDEPGHEQQARITVTGDFDAPGAQLKVKMEFKPDCSDDTSDPTGLLTAMIQSLQVIHGQRTP